MPPCDGDTAIESTVVTLDAVGAACCNTAATSCASSLVSCSPLVFRAPPAPAAPPLYDGSNVFQQLARCAVARPSDPAQGAIVAPSAAKPSTTTHQFAHDILALHRLYTPPQSTSEHFKPSFFPGTSRQTRCLINLDILQYETSLRNYDTPHYCE